MDLSLLIVIAGIIIAVIIHLWRKSHYRVLRHCRDVVVLDFETTGLDPKTDAVVQVAAVKLGRGGRIEKMHTLINPKRSIPVAASRIHGIKQKHVKGAPALEDVLPSLMAFIGDRKIAAYNAPFDIAFLEVALGEKVKNRVVDVLAEARSTFNGLYSYKLSAVTAQLGIKHKAHDALSDSIATLLVLGTIYDRNIKA